MVQTRVNESSPNGHLILHSAQAKYLITLKGHGPLFGAVFHCTTKGERQMSLRSRFSSVLRLERLGDDGTSLHIHQKPIYFIHFIPTTFPKFQ
jgi:hypothetical protein